MHGKHIYTNKIYIISDSAPKHGTDHNQMSFKKLGNRYVSKIYLIVLRPVFSPMYKQNKHVKKYI